MSLHDDTVLVLKSYEDQAELRQAYLDHLAAHPDGVWKACGAGHITASGLVIDPERGQVLLTLHKKLRMWLQMGGHCERDDTTLAGSALREATEESGITGLTLLPGARSASTATTPRAPGIWTSSTRRSRPPEPWRRSATSPSTCAGSRTTRWRPWPTSRSYGWWKPLGRGSDLALSRGLGGLPVWHRQAVGRPRWGNRRGKGRPQWRHAPYTCPR